MVSSDIPVSVEDKGNEIISDLSPNFSKHSTSSHFDNKLVLVHKVSVYGYLGRFYFFFVI